MKFNTEVTVSRHNSNGGGAKGKVSWERVFLPQPGGGSSENNYLRFGRVHRHASPSTEIMQPGHKKTKVTLFSSKQDKVISIEERVQLKNNGRAIEDQVIRVGMA